MPPMPASNDVSEGSITERSVKEIDDESGADSGVVTGMSSPPIQVPRAAGREIGNNVTDFFGSDVFHIVLHNPTTAHRLLKFSQSRACGENMEFLQKVRGSLFVP